MDIERVKEAVKKIEDGYKMLSAGPLSYYLEKLVYHSDTLLNKFAPLKLGQIARICKEIECTGGWTGSEQTLALGATGQITGIEYDDDSFYFCFCPFVQTYRSDDGNYYPVRTKHTYYLRQDYLEGIE